MMMMHESKVRTTLTKTYKHTHILRTLSGKKFREIEGKSNKQQQPRSNITWGVVKQRNFSSLPSSVFIFVAKRTQW